MKRFTLLFLILGCLLISQSYGKTVYFLVAEANEPNHNDSYVLPLSDANDIAHARDLIEFGPAIGQPIVVAQIECGMDGINRDYLASGKPVWSWHVTDFNGFADSTAEILDGWPGLVDSNCAGWIGDTGGYIGFWSYTAVAELGTDPRPWRSDFNVNHKVDFFDYAYWSKRWLWADCMDPNWCDGSDLDKSSSVDINDLAILAAHWLSPYAEAPIWFDWWNNPRQCHGDADGLKYGSPMVGYWYVGAPDADLLYMTEFLYGWPYYYIGQLPGDPDACVDFNRDFKVDEQDEAILQTWWFVKEPPKGSGVPPDCPPEEPLLP